MSMIESEKRIAPACERNRDPILAVLRELLVQPGLVLEIGSGTGQHAAYFAQHLPHLTWQPSDLAENLPSIRAWRAEAGAGNLRAPVVVDLGDGRWPLESVDYVVCINTIHIVAWPLVEALFDRAGALLRPGGVMYVYGPYRYRDRPLEPSNEQFDRWLKGRDPESGIREFEAVDALAQRAGLLLGGDRPMPANNRSIWWVKSHGEQDV